MSTVNIKLGQDHALALSSKRIGHLLEGNTAAAQKMGWFDTFKDMFSGFAKQKALAQLARDFDSSQGLSALDRFQRLSAYANPVDRSQFTVQLQGDHSERSLGFFIRQTLIKTTPALAEEVQAMEARLGVIDDIGRRHTQLSANWLAAHERHDLDLLRQAVTDQALQAGGKHKNFDPGSGILRAEDAQGAEDFQREKAVADLAETTPELARYVSTQQVIAKEDLAATLPAVRSDKTYARVTLYDRNFVDSGELDKKIDGLNADEARSVLMQTIDMARVFYKAGLSHRDLHMHNLMVHKPVGDGQGQITLQAIDFGKSEVELHSESDRLNDVNYLFHKKASSGWLETTRRGARETFQYDLDKQAKHYPLHKLMIQCAKQSVGTGADLSAKGFDKSIGLIGDQLVSELKQAEKLQGDSRLQAIDKAFQQAMHAMGLIMDKLQPKELQPHHLFV